MNGYSTFVAVYQGQQLEVVANTIWEAKQIAVKQLGVPKKKQGLLSIMLGELNGKSVLHSTASL